MYSIRVALYSIWISVCIAEQRVTKMVCLCIKRHRLYRIANEKQSVSPSFQGAKIAKFRYRNIYACTVNTVNPAAACSEQPAIMGRYRPVRCEQDDSRLSDRINGCEWRLRNRINTMHRSARLPRNRILHNATQHWLQLLTCTSPADQMTKWLTRQWSKSAVFISTELWPSTPSVCVADTWSFTKAIGLRALWLSLYVLHS